MRLLCLLIALLPSVAIFSASAISTVSSPLFDPQPCPSLPFSFPRYAHQTQPKRGLLVQWQQWRDRAIRLVWNPPSREARDPAAIISSHTDLATPMSLPAQYSDDAVLRFRIQSEAEAAALAEAVTVLFLDVWEFTADWVDIRLSKRVLPLLLGLLPPTLQRAHTPLMYDLAQAIFDTYPSPSSDEPTQPKPRGYRTFSPALHPPAEETNILFRNYQPLSVLVPWMRLLTSLFPTHVRMISVGISYEGRDIHALRVGVHPTNSERPSAPRKTIIVVGGSHAREWISTSSVAYVAYSLITEYGKTPAVTRLLEQFDWIFIPTVNPDGYVYTWERDRLWRKNRQHTSLRFCKGIDLDRAYGFEWEDASGNNPCSESFSGDRPFEAVESRHFANWVRNETDHKRANFVGFLDLHSYSQQVLYPYSYSCTSTPPSLENLEELAIGLAKAIRLTNGVQYGVTSACEGSVTVEDSIQWPAQDETSLKRRKKKKSSILNTKQPAMRLSHERNGIWPRMESGGGSALDWFYHEVGVRYAYQLKLRDTGNYGFLLPSSYIVPTGQEALNAVRYFGDFLLGSKAMEGAEYPDGGRENEKGRGPIEGERKADGEDGGDEDGEEDEDEYGEENEDEDEDENKIQNEPGSEIETKTQEPNEEEKEQSTSSFELRRRRI